MAVPGSCSHRMKSMRCCMASMIGASETEVDSTARRGQDTMTDQPGSHRAWRMPDAGD